MDRPNPRSSHVRATPRGGGAAIVVVFLASMLAALAIGLIPGDVGTAISAAGLLVAFVGFLDDHRHVAFQWRLGVHFLAATIVVMVSLPGESVITIVFAVTAVVWLLNLFNFMDGIDGLAGIETITVSLSGAWLARLLDLPPIHWVVPMLLAGSTLGFLFWNFPVARIFMGDVGSGFIGLILASVVAQAATVSPALSSAWLVLLGCFVVDATITLLRRAALRQTLHHAHRTHAYQYAARNAGNHWQVTLTVAAINLAWLFPIAYLVATSRLHGLGGLIVAWSPLILLAVVFGAGVPEDRSGDSTR